MVCETQGCLNHAVWVVAKPEREKRVCSKCRDEMIALWGWLLVGPAAGKVTVGFDA